MIMNFRRREPVKVIKYTLKTEKKILELLNGEWSHGGQIMVNNGEKYIRYSDDYGFSYIDLGEYLVYDDGIVEHYSGEDLNCYYVKIEEEE